MKIRLGPLSIDNRILDAIRDDRLVVFAGAGVSMGPPANLPNFDKLAVEIAAGSLGSDDIAPIDRFLGRVSHLGVNVHSRAHAILTNGVQGPTQLHFDLLRLFQKPEKVRLVTTNFDLHFEEAANQLFNSCPEVFRAPALPRGRSFRGLVHVHGSLVDPASMVLTDADFGRAYLTEGWARRFLVDAFRSYTILFVGYSHNDVVMNYLSRALPAEDFAGRFALSDVDGEWKLLGIEPVAFALSTGANRYQELNDGVAAIAERASRAALEWRTKLAEIASRAPPTDDETTGEIEQALQALHTTKFFVDSARHPDWLAWLDQRRLLDSLFVEGHLEPRHNLLCEWIARHYAHDHPSSCFQLLVQHRMQMNGMLWWELARAIGLEKDRQLESELFRRWAAILLDASPIFAASHPLWWLLDKCVDHSEFGLAVELFLKMATATVTVERGFENGSEPQRATRAPLEVKVRISTDQFPLKNAWEKSLRPNLAVVAAPILSGAVRAWQGAQVRLSAWRDSDGERDSRFFIRKAIESHPQDEFRETADVLIDAARDALESLSASDPASLNHWIGFLVASDISLLRRLAIHAVTEHASMSGDQKIGWLVIHAELHSDAIHHEVFRCAKAAYPDASAESRRSLIHRIESTSLVFDQPGEDREWLRSDRLQFDWLSWLSSADPDCNLVVAALATLRAKYPDWQAEEHPDFNGWVGASYTLGSESPRTPEELEAIAPEEQMDFLLSYQGDRFIGPSRDGLLTAVREVCKRNGKWATQLADALATRRLWTDDLWRMLFWTWREASLASAEWAGILRRIADPALLEAHHREVSEFLLGLVDKGGRPYAIELLPEANLLAEQLWAQIKDKREDVSPDDWLSRAINMPAGKLTEFWISGLSMVLKEMSGAERTMPEDYRTWLTEAAENAAEAGGLSRTILASQTAFLFHVDEPSCSASA